MFWFGKQRQTEQKKQRERSEGANNEQDRAIASRKERGEQRPMRARKERERKRDIAERKDQTDERSRKECDMKKAERHVGPKNLEKSGSQKSM